MELNEIKSMNLSKKHLNDYQLASRVIIAGGRDFNDYEHLSTKLNELFKDQNVFNNKAIKVISGMAKGTDTLGIKIVPPIWGGNIIRKMALTQFNLHTP